MISAFDAYDHIDNRTIGIIGILPGVGATTTALALAAATIPHRTNIPLVVEGNIDDPRLHRHLGIIPVAPSFEPLSFDFHEHIHRHPSGFLVIPEHQSVAMHPRREDHVRQLLNEASGRHPLIIIPHTRSEQTPLILDHLNEVIIVTDTTHDAIRAIPDLISQVKDRSHTILGIVLTKTTRANAGPAIGYIERHTPASVICAVPTDAAVLSAKDAYTPITAFRMTSPASRAYTLLARKIL